jgi:NADH-quinone oxidoreductase subunit M
LELIIIPLVLAIGALFVPKSAVRGYGLIGAGGTIAMTLALAVRFVPSADFSHLFLHYQDLPFVFNLGYDGIGLVMILLTTIITFLILLSNYDNEELSSSGKFTALIFFMQFALLGVFLALDGLLFYIFWELSLIPVFLLFLWFGAKGKRKALITFFIYTFVGSLAMLFSLLYIRTMSNSFSLEDLLAVQLTSTTALWVIGGFFIAFAVKIPLFPFHTWQPETYTKSPMAGTMLLGALMLKMALYGMIRWMIPLAPEALEDVTGLIVTLGGIGVVYAAIMAIKQNDMKTLFAYASVSHVGLIAAAIVVVTMDTLTGAMVQIVNHSFVALGLFLSADIIERRVGHRNLLELGGIAKQAPQFAFWFAVIIFAGVSVPLTSGFIGEFLLIKGLFEYKAVAGVLVGTTLILSCVYSFRAYQLSMYGPSKNFKFPDLTWAEWTTYFVITLVVVFLGVYPQFLIDLIEPSLQRVIEIVNVK